MVTGYKISGKMPILWYTSDGKTIVYKRYSTKSPCLRAKQGKRYAMTFESIQHYISYTDFSKASSSSLDTG